MGQKKTHVGIVESEFFSEIGSLNKARSSQKRVPSSPSSSPKVRQESLEKSWSAVVKINV